MLEEILKKNIPKKYQDTIFVRLFGFMKVPMIYWVSPSIVLMDDEQCIVKIPLNRRTKNHLNSMYFGVLCTGADIAGGYVAMNEITNSKKKVALSFKDFKADFLKRAEGDVHFVVNQIPQIKAFVQEVIKSGERMNFPVEINAVVPSLNPEEVVAKFTLTLSLKLKS
ncbi:MAG: PaaI family thioesterase [Bacteriovoracaceae bacterium]|nr:PaaI family thioesterase [Bacteriovoracaceae bacterium]